MSIPEKIKISSKTYEVIQSEQPLFHDNQRAYGHIDFDNQVIELDIKIQKLEGQERTLIHEILHGIVFDREIDFQEDDEETIINQLANGLHQVLKDNKMIT